MKKIYYKTGEVDCTFKSGKSVKDSFRGITVLTKENIEINVAIDGKDFKMFKNGDKVKVTIETI